MDGQVKIETVEGLAPAGFYIALRVGFAFPLEETNALPQPWVDHYTRSGLMLFDPVVRWAYANTGRVRWSDLADSDPQGILTKARTFGLHYGVVVSVFDRNVEGQRSYASFARTDREFDPLEAKLLESYIKRRHREMAPPTNLTLAEIEALRMVKNGHRLKEIAYDLDISEGAVKQRLKNAKLKLAAKTSTQAAAMAAQYGLI